METPELYAVSISSLLGLHRDPRRLRGERMGVWWVLSILDKELSLRSGQMSAISEHGVDVPLPSPSTRFGRRVDLAWIIACVLRLL